MQSSFYSRYLLSMLLSMFLYLPIVLTVGIKLPPNITVTAVLGFGDSIIDAGNNNNNLKTFARSNYPPYGKDFMGGIPTGRFSNGRVPTDLLADEVSIKKYVPAYLDPNLGPQDLLTGVTFASGAVGYDPLTSELALVDPLSTQLEQFKEYIGKLKQLVGEERTQFILNNAVYMVIAGSNDINTYFSAPFRSVKYDIDSYANLIIDYASSFAQELYKLGARRLAIFGVPPLGCVPSIRTIRGGILRACAENYNAFAQLLNSKLHAELDSLNGKLPNSRVVYINIYDTLLNFIQNPSKFGFEQAKKGCCGTGLIEVTLLCNKFVPVCANDSKYLFWDSFHPTERGYQQLISTLVNKYAAFLF